MSKEFEPKKAAFREFNASEAEPITGPASLDRSVFRDYFLAFALPAFLALLDRALKPYLDLKHDRHRASRLFLKDGARSLLPQYLQTSLPNCPFNDRLARRDAVRLLVGEALAARVGFFTAVV